MGNFSDTGDDEGWQVWILRGETGSRARKFVLEYGVAGIAGYRDLAE